MNSRSLLGHDSDNFSHKQEERFIPSESPKASSTLRFEHCHALTHECGVNGHPPPSDYGPFFLHHTRMWPIISPHVAGKESAMRKRICFVLVSALLLLPLGSEAQKGRASSSSRSST